MSDEVEAAVPPATVITPAKSQDKLEIEQEEKEKEVVAEGEAKKEGGEEEKKDDDEKKDEDKKDDDKKAAEAAGGKKKRFKKPQVHLKAPKVPGFLRSKSKDRQKEKVEKEGETKKAKEAEDVKTEPKDEAAEAKDEKPKETDDVKKEEEAAGAEEKKDDDEKDKKEEEDKPAEGAEKEPSKLNKLLDNVHQIHLPKMPKFSKPKFMKKAEADKSAEDEPKETEMKDMSADKPEDKAEDKEDKAEQDKDKEDETDKKAEAAGGEAAEKKPSFLDSLKSISVPSIFHKKPAKEKPQSDLEAGGEKEEAKELLEGEKKEGDETAEKKDLEEPKDGEEEEKKDETAEVEKKESKARGFLDGLRNVATHVPALFSRKQKDAATDVEAQETKELLDDKDDSNKKEEGDLEEVKVVGEKEKDAASACGSEKKDQEKQQEKKEKCAAAKRLQAVRAEVAGWDRQQRRCALGALLAALLLLLIIVLSVVCSSSERANEMVVSEDGAFVETHTMCGPVQGLVDGPSQFTFRRIPYAVPALPPAGRFAPSRPAVALAECFEGRLAAHGHANDSRGGRCWRRYPDGKAAGQEDCLTLDVFTTNVDYEDLMPVVVYVDGEDLTWEEEEKLKPTSALAKDNRVVFVDLRYRRGVLGFLSLQSLSKRTYPNSSGNYGLGDIISALRWISLNIQHFGGHPKMVTLLGRGSGATLVTALTAAPKAKGLFQRAWATNGAGVFADVSLKKANTENKAILNTLKCGADEVACLSSASPEALTLAAPSQWYETNLPDLPMEGDSSAQHSWVIADKAVLFQETREYWKKNRLTNNVPIVFGATAQGEVTADNLAFLAWNNTNSFTAHVEGRLGSFNVSLPSQALALYNSSSSNWAAYAAMVTDIRTVCPLQDLALTASNNFVANVYSYVATHQRNTTELGLLADRTADVAAIFGLIEESAGDSKFVDQMQGMFFQYVRTGTLPQNKDITLGMYLVGEEMTTLKDYPTCDFWRRAGEIVPKFASLY